MAKLIFNFYSCEFLTMLAAIQNVLIALLLSLVNPAMAQMATELPNYTLRHAVVTSASKDQVWELWSNVERWKDYDKIVEYAVLKDNADFVQGTQGYVKTTKAPRTRFTLIEVTEGSSFTEKLHLPLGQSILLKRYFGESQVDKQGTPMITVVHEVVFKGRLRSIVYLLSANAFKQDMPVVMNELARLAEGAQSEQE